ncbi:MAG: phage terminase small subunit P27 family [Planctomycetes bacterium]|nr:phage terminase small subunit P27 family [Planctomycetota bacterium]
MRGRKPKPAAIRALEGNPGHRALPEGPKPPVKLPEPPKELSPAAKRQWHRLGPKFAAMGVVAEVDELAFAQLCDSYSAWLSLLKTGRKNGPIVRVNGQPVPNPYLVRADREAEKIRKLLVEFGGTPSARARLSVPNGSASAGSDDIESFMRLAQ